MKTKKAKKNQNVSIKSLNEIDVEYSETCDIDHLYILKLGNIDYTVSVRYESKDNEADLLFLTKEDDILIGKIPTSKTNLKKFIASATLSYLVGCGLVELEKKEW